MSERILVLKEGRLVEQGCADEIYKNPESEYTRALLDAIPDQK